MLDNYVSMRYNILIEERENLPLKEKGPPLNKKDKAGPSSNKLEEIVTKFGGYFYVFASVGEYKSSASNG